MMLEAVLRRSRLVLVVAGLSVGAVAAAERRETGPRDRVAPGPASGPLRVSASNPRYFGDDHGRIVYLTGAHTWNNFQDRGPSAPPPPFDYAGYLDLLVRHGHNFMRLWVWEHARSPTSNEPERVSHVEPMPYARAGARTFDLTRFNEAYFERLRSRVVAAGARGIYVSVMLFQGWSIEKKSGQRDPWRGHPFNAANNVNGVNGDLDGDGEGKETHTLQSAEIVALQERYVRKVIDTLHDLDNVLWEISNESHAASEAWQHHMMQVIRRHEATKPKQHPIGMTVTRFDTNAYLFESPATWISPSSAGGYKDNPPPAGGDKVIITDTDHLWGVGGDGAWVWKSFLRGLNPVYMDDLGPDSERARKADARRAMGDARAYAHRIDLARMTPQTDLASTRYCLANPGVEYLVYVPFERHWIASRLASVRFVRRFERFITRTSLWLQGWFRQTVRVDLSAATGALALEWFDPRTSAVVGRGTVEGGAVRSMTTPSAGPAVLYLRVR